MKMIAQTRIPRAGGAVLAGQEFETSAERAAHYVQIGWAVPVGASAAPAAATPSKTKGKGKGSVKDAPPKVGDQVNVEIDGVLQFPKPVELLEIFEHEDKSWARVAGSDSAVLFDQLVRG